MCTVHLREWPNFNVQRTFRRNERHCKAEKQMTACLKTALGWLNKCSLAAIKKKHILDANVKSKDDK